MKHATQSTLATLVLFLHLAAPVAAGPLEDGLAAVERHDWDTALRNWRPLADEGDRTAQHNLGVMYDNGYGVPQDYAEAVKWYRKSAEQGNPLAQNNLGLMYDNAHGVTQDYAEAVKWYRKSADQGHATAQNNLGFMYENGHGVVQDYAEAVKWYRKSAEQDEAAAQYNLGRMYYNGQGVSENDSEAVKWYRKSAEQDYPEAQFALGAMYEKGQGVMQDDAEAVTWFRKAADQRNAHAQYILGLKYEEGQGVMQDYIEAHKWLNLAAAQDAEGASEERAAIAKRMAPYQMAQAQQLAREWRPQNGGSRRPDDTRTLAKRNRAGAGNALAQLDLGDLYYFGRGVAQDYVEAVKWYRLSADQGNPDAQYKLGSMYEHNEAVVPGGIVPAKRGLASSIYDKEGADTQQYAEAAKWYRRSAEQGNADAQYAFGRLYENGTGVDQDHVEAYKWFNLAADKGRADAAKERDHAAKLMIPSQIAKAQQLARQWKARISP